MNYINGTCDRGFAVFKVNDGKTVRDENEFRCDNVFSKVEHHEGETDYEAAEFILDQLKQAYLSVKQYIKNSGPGANNRILGDSKDDMILKNRLINDVL
jgi:hypothetical protein